MLLYPKTLKISSITSTSRCTSTRYGGIFKPKPVSEILLILISKDANIFLIVSFFNSSPIKLFTFSKDKKTLKSSIFFG